MTLHVRSTIVIAAVLVLICGPTTGQAQAFTRDGDNDDTIRLERERQAREAKADLESAEAQLEAAAMRVRASWRANPDLIAAEKEFNTAREARNHERHRVIQSLENDPAYQKLRQEHANATEEVRSEQERVNATQPEENASPATLPSPSAAQFEAASERLEVKSELRRFEDRAIAADKQAAAASARFEAAQEKLQTLNAQLDAALLNDADYKAAQDQVAAARGRLISPGQ